MFIEWGICLRDFNFNPSCSQQGRALGLIMTDGRQIILTIGRVMGRALGYAHTKYARPCSIPLERGDVHGSWLI